MTLPLQDVLDEAGRGHLARLLDASVRAGPAAEAMRARVRDFVASQVSLAPEAEPAFRALPARERERLLSELAWRITCHLDGSITRVLGVQTILLGYGFAAVVSERGGRDVFVLVEDR